MENFTEESMNTAKKEAAHVLTQFDLTNGVITKLNTFKLTPTAKLVLLYLTTCYNPKHADIFPKQKTIAEKLGISERSVTRAIQELHKEGLILIECKYTNRYKFTSKIAQNCPVILTDSLGQNDRSKGDKLTPYDIEQKRVIKKEQTVINKGGNVYSNDDDAILIDYAEKHNAKNIRAYISKLKETKSAVKIISEYKKKRNYTQIALRSYKETQNQIRMYEEYRKDSITPENITAWKELGIKLGIKK